MNALFVLVLRNNVPQKDAGLALHRRALAMRPHRSGSNRVRT